MNNKIINIGRVRQNMNKKGERPTITDDCIIKILKYRKNIMNIEEISKWLLENVNKCETCEFYNISCNKKYCLQGHLNWLVKNENRI